MRVPTCEQRRVAAYLIISPPCLKSVIVSPLLSVAGLCRIFNHLSPLLKIHHCLPIAFRGRSLLSLRFKALLLSPWAAVQPPLSWPSHFSVHLLFIQVSFTEIPVHPVLSLSLPLGLPHSVFFTNEFLLVRDSAPCSLLTNLL